jgi:hypothetical protein
MKAIVSHGHRDLRVEDVPDPKILEAGDAIVRIERTARFYWSSMRIPDRTRSPRPGSLPRSPT